MQRRNTHGYVRRTVLVLAAMALAAAIVFVGLVLADDRLLTDNQRAEAQTTHFKPNFVFILTDDVRKDDLKYMPKTLALLKTQGMHFENAFVSLPVCCPSRATIMRGQYAHNTGVWGNGYNGKPDGGWQGYKNHGNEEDNLATRLHDAGYRTGLFGKYLNLYSGTTKPPGWDDWFAMLTEEAVFNYYVNDNGTRKFFGNSESDYVTDVLSKETQSFIDDSVGVGKPFFAYVAPEPPHEPAIPAPRHEHAFDGEKAPRLDSFNEREVGDKPPSIRSLPELSQTQVAQIDAHHEKRVEALQAVDDLVEAVVGKLQSHEALDNTYVVLTSDNGWHYGEHRIQSGKGTPYEESIRVPLLVRGPSVQTDTTTDKLTLNTDFFPTFTDLAGVTTPAYVDGRSLRPVLEGSATSWRSAVLLEQRSFCGIRTSDGRKYIEYGDGFKEYYDLQADPYELNNSYNANAPPAALASRLQALKGCGGNDCRTAEGDDTTTTPPPPPIEPVPGPPTVVSTVPNANEPGVAPTIDVKATFSEDMDASISGRTFKLFKKGTTTKIAATVSYPDPNSPPYTAKLDPNNSLGSGVTYKAVVTTGAMDSVGNPLGQQYKWFFTVN